MKLISTLVFALALQASSAFAAGIQTPRAMTPKFNPYDLAEVTRVLKGLIHEYEETQIAVSINPVDGNTCRKSSNGMICELDYTHEDRWNGTMVATFRIVNGGVSTLSEIEFSGCF